MFAPAQLSPGGILSFTIEGTHPEEIGRALDEDHIAIRTGSMCAHLLMKHIGIPGLARASFHLYNTKEDVLALYQSLRSVNQTSHRPRQDNDRVESSPDCGCFVTAAEEKKQLHRPGESNRIYTIYYQG